MMKRLSPILRSCCDYDIEVHIPSRISYSVAKGTVYPFHQTWVVSVFLCLLRKAHTMNNSDTANEQASYFVHPGAEVSPDAHVGADTRIWRQAHVREYQARM